MNKTRSIAIFVLLGVLFVFFPAAQAKEVAPLKVKSGANHAQEAQKRAPDSKDAIKVTFVELGSVRCIPCKAMQPVMKEIKEGYGNQVKVVFYDVWTNEGTPYGKQYKIQAIPTQVFLDKDGMEFFRHMGFFPTEEIAKVLEKQGIKRSNASDKAPGKTGNTDTKLQSGEVCK